MYESNDNRLGVDLELPREMMPDLVEDTQNILTRQTHRNGGLLSNLVESLGLENSGCNTAFVSAIALSRSSMLNFGEKKSQI